MAQFKRAAITGRSLAAYRKKRNFKRTAEPAGSIRSNRKAARLYVIQKHAARRLHYDLRLEIGGVLASWAVPKGPSLDPDERRLAVHVEDHPLEYGRFEGRIPEGEYGAGDVIVWDIGTWQHLSAHTVNEDMRRGRLTFMLKGKKLRGVWSLVRMKGKGENWLFFKHKDKYAKPSGTQAEITELKPNSVLTRRAVRLYSPKKRAA